MCSDDDYAMIIDQQVANLRNYHYDLFCVLNLFYLVRINQDETAKQLNWSKAKVKQKLSVARDVIKGMVFVTQQKSANE